MSKVFIIKASDLVLKFTEDISPPIFYMAEYKRFIKSGDAIKTAKTRYVVSCIKSD